MHGNDILGLVLTVSMVLICWTVAWYVKKTNFFGDLTREVARKVVHIGVSNFAFVYLYIFESWAIPFAGLIAFTFINLWIELHVGTRRSWGTVQYPLVIALLVLIVHLGTGSKEALVCAVLGMGYGDGLAALVGMKIGKHRLPGTDSKTLEGSLTVFIVVLFVCLAFSGKGFGVSLITALVAAAAEAWTPWGLDNISVPLLIFTVAGVLF